MLRRWNCVLDAFAADVGAHYRQLTQVALATVLHRNGLADESLTNGALAAIEHLNAAVALSDEFARKSNEIQALLLAPPEPIRRRPASQRSLTFYRAGDVLSLRVGARWHALYVNEIVAHNKAPIVELYDFLLGTTAKPGGSGWPPFGRGALRRWQHARGVGLYGQIHLPDLANQIHLVAGAVRPPNAAVDRAVPSL